MTSNIPNLNWKNNRERGAATLIVAVVLLALLTVTVLVVSQNVSLELRAAANSNRDKEALEVAQGATEYGAMLYLTNGTTSDALTIPISTSGAPASYTVSDVGGVISVVGQGTSQDLSAAKTVAEDFGVFTVGDIGELPPLMAGGNFPPNGTFSIVANPNGGSEGVPVSAWANTASGASGTWQTCQLDEYLQSGSSYNVQSDGYTICDDCDCKAVSIDHLCDAADVTNGSDCPDIVDDSESCIPDTFENLFAVDVINSTCGDVSGTRVSPSEHVLGLTGGRTISSCDSSVLNSTSGVDPAGNDWADSNGMPILFYNGSTSCDLQHDVGSYDDPVLLVTTADTKINAGARIFGIVFVLNRCMAGYSAEQDCGSYDTPDITANGGGKLYGSLIASDDVSLPNGNMSVVWAPGVLDGLFNDGDGWDGLARRAGSWRDFQ